MDTSSLQGMPCDIFCNVVDNYGDIGVAWRLARQLAGEHEIQVRLWLDDLATLQRIWPATDIDRPIQQISGIEVRRWVEPFPETSPAPLVIEAFGCALPERYLAAMARREPRPLWLNLEYLSAEAWVKGCHGLPSPHPRLPLTAYFYYPGFEPETGGLIRETGLMAQRKAYQADPNQQTLFRQSIRLAPPPSDTLSVSLFAYDHPGVPELLTAWSAGTAKVRCLLPEGVARDGVARFAGGSVVPGQTLRRGNLELCSLPFLDQLAYDRLLWSCDLNLVRGEDSFVRAQWAALPLIWNIYAQPDHAHWPKLQAFLDLYCHGLSPEATAAYRAFTEAWNRGQGLTAAWPALLPHRAELARHARAWADHLADMPDLARKLMHFCKEKL